MTSTREGFRSQRSPAGRDSRGDEARQLIRLSRKVKGSTEDALVARLNKAATELDAGKGVPLERVREDIREWAKNPKK